MSFKDEVENFLDMEVHPKVKDGNKDAFPKKMRDWLQDYIRVLEYHINDAFQKGITQSRIIDKIINTDIERRWHTQDPTLSAHIADLIGVPDAQDGERMPRKLDMLLDGVYDPENQKRVNAAIRNLEFQERTCYQYEHDLKRIKEELLPALHRWEKGETPDMDELIMMDYITDQIKGQDPELQESSPCFVLEADAMPSAKIHESSKVKPLLTTLAIAANKEYRAKKRNIQPQGTRIAQSPESGGIGNP